MGYTHYFPHTEIIDSETWSAIVKDCKKLVEASTVPIANWDGEPGTEPEFTDSEISFNGVGNEAHESFVLCRSPEEGDFHYCKTSRKPYDEVVCACLIAYYFWSPDTIEISSDGDLEDWKEGLQFASEVLGNGPVARFLISVNL